LHSAASQLAKVGDPIVRREYERFVSKLVGVDLEDVDRAVESRRRPEPRPGRSQRRRSNPRRRLESEILRLMISGGEGTGELTAEIFSEPDLREAARILEAARAGEEAVDITRLDVGEDVRSLLMAHAVQGAPDARDHLLARARAMRIDAEIDRLEAVVAATDPSDEGYSQAFNRLIALQREKRNT